MSRTRYNIMLKLGELEHLYVFYKNLQKKQKKNVFNNKSERFFFFSVITIVYI